jgi:hypothetical protein
MSERTAVTLRSLIDIAAAVPGVLGFAPTESLVLLAADGGPSARVDLVPGCAEAIAGPIAPHVNRCVVLVYTNGEPEPWLSDAIATFTAAGIEVMVPGLHVEGSHVHVGDQSWEFDVRDSEVTAQRVLEGRTVASSREELAALVAYDGRSTPCLPDLDDDETRDSWVTCIRPGAKQLAFYTNLLSQTADDHPYIGHVSALAACSAWVNGNGGLAWLCLDRTEHTTLGALVASMLEHAVNPDNFLAMFGEPS